MKGFWPFKKKAAAAEQPKVVIYSKGDTHADEILADRSHIEDDQYKAALDLLTKPHLGGESGGVIAGKSVIEAGAETPDLLGVGVPEGQPAPAPQERDDVKPADGEGFVQSSDGYWYRKKPDGTYDATAHIRGEDGTFTPYS